MISKRAAAVNGIIQLLGASGLGVDDQIKVLGEARAVVVAPYRIERKFTGELKKPGGRKREAEKK